LYFSWRYSCSLRENYLAGQASRGYFHKKRELFFLFSFNNVSGNKRDHKRDFMVMATKINYKKIFFCFIFMLLGITVTNILAFTRYQEPTVRVAILRDVKSFGLSLNGSYQIVNPQTQEVYKRSRSISNAEVSLFAQGIRVDNEDYFVSHLRIETSQGVSIRVDGKIKKYRGSIDIFKEKNGSLLVINRLELKRYIKGVLYHEISDRWPMEAMKAQAVAVRTYTLYQLNKNKLQLYDVRNDIYSQMYGGKDAERYRTSIAVNRTRGEILTYRGKIFPAYYHANSGGYTENVSELWEHNLPPLKGVKSDYSIGMPAYAWKRNFRSSDIQEKLNSAGYKIGAIKDIVVLERNESGRIRWLELIDRTGKKIKISGKIFREIVGPNDIRSNNYDVVMKGYYFDLIGKGWGHGVGLCQWGANNMAHQRFSYKDILAFYYPETVMVDYREEKGLKSIE